MPMKTVAALLIVIHFHLFSQSETDVWPDTVSADPLLLSGPGLDSLQLALASLEISKAAEEVASTDFWHRLMPRISIDAGIGIRDVAFRDAGGVFVLPKDSYRLTLGLSISELIDGSAHSRAGLHLEETEVRYALLLRKQRAARLALVRKRAELLSELEALREEIPLRESDLACRELLFAQGHADFHALAGAKIDLLRLKCSSARLAAMVLAMGKALAGDPGP
jgi:hypothetical protein